MDIAIGLPNAVPGTEGGQLIEWARRSEDAGFSSLGTIDRLVYPNYESLVALAAAAAVTKRIGLATTVLLAPYRGNPALLAKQAATLQRLSDGRLTLGLGIGWREDDYETSGLPYGERGALFDQALEQLGPLWQRSASDTALGPDVSAKPPRVILGGSIDKAFRRAAKYGTGWMLGGGTPEQFADGREQLATAWSEAGREGTRGPRRSPISRSATRPRPTPGPTSRTTTRSGARSGGGDRRLRGDGCQHRSRVHRGVRRRRLRRAVPDALLARPRAGRPARRGGALDLGGVASLAARRRGTGRRDDRPDHAIPERPVPDPRRLPPGRPGG